MTPKRLAILRWVFDHNIRTGTRPTIRQIAAGTEISVANAHEHVGHLRVSGWMRLGNGQNGCGFAADYLPRTGDWDGFVDGLEARARKLKL